MTITSTIGAATPPATRPRRRKTTAPPTGTDRIPQPSAGWYRDKVTGTKLRRVTTILNLGSSKEALVFWSANFTAQTAIDNLPQLISSSRTRQDREEAYDWLRKAHIRRKEERGDVGTAVHKLIEAQILGTPVPADLRDDPEMKPYIDHFFGFVRDWQIDFEASEMVVGNFEEGYAGTLDYLYRSPIIASLLGVPADTLFEGDTKTGGELDVKGVYSEAGLQMAAYRGAKVCWLRDGTQIPMPRVHSTGIVLHLRPEGYRVVPVECGDEVFAAFRDVQRVAAWTSGLSKSVVGQPLQLPTVTEKVAA
ncbi:hypothetical protein OG689_10480 [Kitasatospora sp. NBC_00240]|uniref:hypothetical protein n=1 Tax=Kitasatospora sp. NBC_00240 TaxID=2903567 RepID=UPI00224E3E49|nr:hypothetical protein [Kitasatospora sp. NBC_00240]MCX5209708.1 hypothetical protein [Kitasatospora sp. NBC_00240]